MLTYLQSYDEGMFKQKNKLILTEIFFYQIDNMLFAIFQNRIIYTNINQNREKSILRKPHQIIMLQRKAIATHNNIQTA